MKITRFIPGRIVVEFRGVFTALLLAGCLLGPKIATAAPRVEFNAWEATHSFHMIIDVEIDPATKAVKIDGGRIELRGATGIVLPIQQAQGSRVPPPQPNKMAGVVMYSQVAGTATANLFTGTLVGDLTNGTLTATGVSFEVYNQNHIGLTFVMVNGNGGKSMPSAPAPAAPGTLAPVGLTTQQQQLITNYNAGKNAPVATPVAPAAPVPSNAATIVYMDNSNPGGVTQMAGTKRPNFLSRVPVTITEIWTYHWNNGHGANPGTISLIGTNGVTYGPWRASGSSGQGGAPNVNWTVHPNVQLPAGGYTVVDSDPVSWSENAASHECGFTKVSGHN
jgi:hypothetical protein